MTLATVLSEILQYTRVGAPTRLTPPSSPSDTASGIFHHIHLSTLKSLSVRSIYNHLPFTLKLSAPEYILVRVLSLLHTLAQISPDTNFSSRTSAR